METFALAAVLASALMHATWNAIVKISGDRFVVMSLIDFMALLCLVPFAPMFPLPNPATWGYVAVSVVLNTFYRLFLIRAYQRGDLSQVYPIMRGSSPVFVAGLAFVFAGETLSAKEWTGFVLIICGIVNLAGLSDIKRAQKLLPYAVGAGLFIASYTVVDALGVRLADSKTHFIFWLLLAEQIPFPVLSVFLRKETMWKAITHEWKRGALGGLNQIGAYAIVLWVLTYNPIAGVSALREISVIIAALIGRVMLKENFGIKRWLSVVLVTFGIVVMHG